VTRVLFTCWPFEGHVFPQLSMALALRRRGAEVAFYTDASMREVIEGAGFEVLPFGRVAPDWLRVHGRERGTGGRREAIRLMRASREWLVGSIPAQVDDLLELVDRWRPDVIAADASMWGPLLVLPELVPVPVALASPLIGAQVPGPQSPVAFGLPPDSRGARLVRAAGTRLMDVAAHRMRGAVDEARAARGLGPMGCSINARLGRLPLYQVLSVRELDYPRTDLPPSVRYVGACLWHPPQPPGTQEALDALTTAQPWVHVTEGTSRFADPFLLRAAAEGLAGGPWEAILTTGRGLDAAQAALVRPAANVHVMPWLSHDVLLPRCAAVVTTGGMGTIMSALRAGVPLVVVPTGWDKPTNARRVEATGVGVALTPRRCTPDTLRAAVAQVLQDPQIRARARRAADLLAAAPGPDGAAENLERLAARTPTPTPAPAGGRS
jgi:MGT family glycosyltransferase